MDMEELINSIVVPWWGEPIMHHECWASLLACRTTLHRCGHSTQSDEYQTLELLLNIFHARES